MHRGGEGVVRDIEFRIPVQVSILSERRVYHPYGMEGGGEAGCGLNIWVRKVDKKAVDSNSDASQSSEGDGAKTSAAVEGLVKEQEKEKKRDGDAEVEYRYINLGAKNTASMKPGERIVIYTPGGGGWGKEGESSKAVRKEDPRSAWRQGSVAGRQQTAEASA
jgi:5-oxoprolinase (ATP-hydrolysing)